jgi:hypothetical protein
MHLRPAASADSLRVEWQNHGSRHMIERSGSAAPPEHGALAQLVERFVRNEKVRGSIPLSSTLCRDFGGSEGPGITLLSQYGPIRAMNLMVMTSRYRL